MTIKRSIIGNRAPAYENRLDRDPKSSTFGKKLHYPLHVDGSVSGEGFVKAADALRAHRIMVTKAVELARTEGHNAHDEGLDIESSPYTGELDRAWRAGWQRADSDVEATVEDDEELTDRDLIGDVNPVVDEAQV